MLLLNHSLNISVWFVFSRLLQLICNSVSWKGLGHWAWLAPSWELFTDLPETFGSWRLDRARLLNRREGRVSWEPSLTPW